jgi:hypothetical protein
LMLHITSGLSGISALANVRKVQQHLSPYRY